MLLTALYSKIHRATVTDADLHYEGSLTIDAHLAQLAGLHEFQQIQIYNITTGDRFTTYTLLGPKNSGVIQVNGAAAHKATTGNLIIIAAYVQLEPQALQDWSPKLVYVDANNQPAKRPEGLLLPA
jgi:aspartate 1-decarboxylase